MIPQSKVIITITGAGSFLLRRRPIVRRRIRMESTETPFFRNKITPELAIKPPATAVIPFKETLIPLICFKDSHMG